MIELEYISFDDYVNSQSTQKKREVFKGKDAYIFQHYIDLLNGIPFIDMSRSYGFISVNDDLNILKDIIYFYQSKIYESLISDEDKLKYDYLFSIFNSIEYSIDSKSRRRLWNEDIYEEGECNKKILFEVVKSYEKVCDLYVNFKNRCGVKRESESVFDFEKNMIIDIEKGLRKEMRNRL